MSRLFAAILIVLLLAPAGRAQEVYVDNVVIVLDASGSMDKTMRGSSSHKMRTAQSAIKEVMGTIPQTTQVGLLVFGGTANGWVYPLGPRDDAELFRAVDGLSAGGGTPLGAYMKKGADRLLKARTSQYGYGSYRLLVVTDGEANDAGLVEAYTPEIAARGIVIDVIGVDMAKAHTLATKVHSYRRANDAAALKQAIQEVFAEVGKASDGQAEERAFEELAGLSDDMAMAIISALVSSGNHPIGATPEDGDASKAPKTPTVSSHVPPPSGASRHRRGKSNWIVAVIIITAAVILGAKSKKGRRR